MPENLLRRSRSAAFVRSMILSCGYGSIRRGKIFDFKPFLDYPAFAPLADKDVFRAVYIDYGVTVWNDGNIDIAPETLYREGTAAGGAVSA